MNSDKNDSPEELNAKTFVGIDGRRQPDRRTLNDRRRPWVKGHWKGPERRFHQRRRTKYLNADDNIDERNYDRRREQRKKKKKRDNDMAESERRKDERRKAEEKPLNNELA
ncbi:MAG: hypothetical protein HY807_08935 [Nitrospirae bacterium]|nr:hypothetical protein [Nitrospirota bacterium]